LTKAKDLAIQKGHGEIAVAISKRINLLEKRADVIKVVNNKLLYHHFVLEKLYLVALGRL